MHELTEAAHGTLTDLRHTRTHKSRCVPAVPGGRPASGVGLTSREQTQRDTHVLHSNRARDAGIVHPFSVSRSLAPRLCLHNPHLKS